MPHNPPSRWTRADVEIWLVLTERANPRDRSPTLATARSWLTRFVDDHIVREYVRTWACTKAYGHSMREICRERGWKRETVKRKRAEACEAIAAGLNEAERLKQPER